MNGFVFQPHGTAGGGGTSKIKVVNAKTTAGFVLQWRFRRGADPWSPFLKQGATAAHLIPGSFTVNFKMTAAGSAHTAPPNETVSLGTNELETLTVVWA